ncbi:MAG: hypothetical protein ACTSQJ_18585 [Promethearchaeota archaeon]
MIYSILQKLAASIRYQNLFHASKQINGVRLFKNTRDFSLLQQIFISYLYNFEAIHNDIAFEKISKRVLEDTIFSDAYLAWKQKRKKDNKKSKKRRDVSLVPAKFIKFKRQGK